MSQATASDISTATVISVPGTVTVGSQISLSANVIASETAGGTVQFMDGDTPIGQAVVLVNGVATMGHTFDKVEVLTRLPLSTAVLPDSPARRRRLLPSSSKRPRPATVAADPVIFFRSVPDLRALLAEEYSCL